MGHPAKMKAITAGKKKSDAIDARTIADLLRCDLLPTCYVLPPETRDLRRLLRYRNLVVQQSVRMQNKMAGLLMESGTCFHKDKLHGKKYFTALRKSLEEVPESVKDLLRMSRGSMEMFESTQKQNVKRLLAEPALQQRLERLTSIRGVGSITALTWALGVADPHRFPSIGDAVSYCGLTAAFRSSAGKQQRGPYLQTTQRLTTNSADRSSQAGATMESATGRTACQTARTGPSQSGYLAGSPKVGRVPAGCGQERPVFSNGDPATCTPGSCERKKKKENSASKSCVAAAISSVRSVSDPPAGPCAFGDCARGLELPIHPLSCFKGGRSTSTQSS